MKKGSLLFYLLSLFLTQIYAQPNFSDEAIETFDLSELEWRLWGYRPEGWRNNFDMETFSAPFAEIRGVPVNVPGSVNKALLDAGIIKDWNIGLNHQDSEWIENRSWLFATRIPDEWIPENKMLRIRFKGLDDNGTVLINGKVAGTFDNSFIPYTFNIDPYLKESNNTLVVAFNPPPKSSLGQVGWTSKIKDWKPRFYYGWDWIPRIVQIGIWDRAIMETMHKGQPEIENLSIITSADQKKDIGALTIQADMTNSARRDNATLRLIDQEGRILINETLPAVEYETGKTFENLKIRRWWPNGSGQQNLYKLNFTLTNASGDIYQEITRRIGFKNVQWLPAKGAPPEADPWICSINNKPVFLQGINWTPIRPNFADLSEEDYRKRLTAYKKLGINTIRIWGGGFAEKDWLYQMCDEMGFLIQQDFPLSSSGLDNYPPETAPEILTMTTIARSYLQRKKHHVSIFLWTGGNELYEYGDYAAVTNKHPMIKAIETVVKSEDPIRRFVPSSPSGKNIWGGRASFGKGINWDTHGPWKLPYTENDRTMKAVKEYWIADDALMHSEVGVAGAMSADMIRKYKGDQQDIPANPGNPYWNRFNWWLEWEEFLERREKSSPMKLEEYVEWSQSRQTQGLGIASKASKDKFPATGGFLIWMGHDSFPAPINTSIMDFDGNLKPVAYELKKIFTNN